MRRFSWLVVAALLLAAPSSARAQETGYTAPALAWAGESAGGAYVVTAGYWVASSTTSGTAYTLALPSGNTVAVAATLTYGDIYLTTAIMLLAVMVLLYMIYRMVQQWLLPLWMK